MNRSPLQLKHYHYRAMSLKVRQDVDLLKLSGEQQYEPYPEFEDVDLLPEVSLYSDGAESQCGPYLLKLSLSHIPATNSNIPYQFEAVIEGIFVLADIEKSEDECKTLVVINGGSMLYSAVRDQLLTLSARHLYGPMLLPSLDFRHLNLGQQPPKN